MPGPGFENRSVLLLETRRATELATLIEHFGGRAIRAPSLREVAVDTRAETLAAVADIINDRFDAVIFLTGVGARRVLDLVDSSGQRGAYAAALNRTKVIARGPKPLPVLRELGVTAWAIAPEPNTWKEVVAALDHRAHELPLTGAHVALQEYGGPSTALIGALESRGAHVTSMFVYRWALPDDVGPLERAVRQICAGEIDVLLVTSAVQVAHLAAVADRLGCNDKMHRQLARRVVLASIGPTSSAALRDHGLEPDLEASPPKMGILVTEAAGRAAGLIAAKRGA